MSRDKFKKVLSIKSLDIFELGGKVIAGVIVMNEFECSYPRCGRGTTISLYGHGLCEKHWELHCDQRSECGRGELSKVEEKICGVRERNEILKYRESEKDVVIPDPDNPIIEEPNITFGYQDVDDE